MKVLITGCAGFIGGNLTERFLEDGYDVLGVDCITYAGNSETIAELHTNKNFTFQKKRIGEITSDDLKQVSLVVNLAAESHVDNSIRNSESFVQTNIIETHRLLNVCRETETPILHFSTDEVYGVVDDGSFVETDYMNPRNPYSATKASIDHLIYSYQNTYDFKSTIIRPSNNFGPRQNKEKFIPTIVRSICDGKKIPIYGKGEQVREWTFVKHTAAAASFLSSEILNGRCIGEIFNFSSSVEMKNVDMVVNVCRIMNVDFESSTEFVEDRLGHDFRYSVDCKKILNAGFSFTVDFEKELTTTVQRLVMENK